MAGGHLAMLSAARSRAQSGLDEMPVQYRFSSGTNLKIKLNENRLHLYNAALGFVCLGQGLSVPFFATNCEVHMQRIHDASNRPERNPNHARHDVDLDKPIEISLRAIPFQIHETREIIEIVEGYQTSKETLHASFGPRTTKCCATGTCMIWH
ncbi:hypothetical protein [Burkholderia stagnalis]|uniref:hypothetical protein n=1 Tax=Burkholderia stagnalis TaxID=1503054 RepID=UPI000F7FC14B|nr:hypothetical protein [Burkholderia stagnalis]